MSDDTRALIEQLAGRAQAVRPLPSPMIRTLLWTAVALAVIAVVAASYGLRTDLWAALSQPAQAMEWLGSVLTGVFAAYAAFQISVPGRSPSWAWLPAAPVALWLGGLGFGCLHDVSVQGPAALAFQMHSGECARAIVGMSLPLALVMVVMVRHAGVVRPAPTAMLAALSAAALCSAGVSLFHAGETELISTGRQFGVVPVLSVARFAVAGRVFLWIGHAQRS